MPSPTESWNSGPVGCVSTLLNSTVGVVVVTVWPLALMVVCATGYRGGGGRTLWANTNGIVRSCISYNFLLPKESKADLQHGIVMAPCRSHKANAGYELAKDASRQAHGSTVNVIGPLVV